MITYDLKISETFSGILTYTKEDYLTPSVKNIEYSFHFKEGVLVFVDLFYKKIGHNGEWELIHKISDPEKFSGEFWKKAPKKLCFDDSKWERVAISTRIGGFFSLNWGDCIAINCVV